MTDHSHTLQLDPAKRAQSTPDPFTPGYTPRPTTPPPNSAAAETPPLIDPSNATFPRLTPYLRDVTALPPGFSDSNITMPDFLPSPDPNAMYNAASFASPFMRDFYPSNSLQYDSPSNRSPSPFTSIDCDARASAAAAEFNALFIPHMPSVLGDDHPSHIVPLPPNFSNMSFPELRGSSSNISLTQSEQQRPLSVNPLLPLPSVPAPANSPPEKSMRPDNDFNCDTSNHQATGKSSASQTSSYTPPPHDISTVSPSTSPEGLDDLPNQGGKSCPAGSTRSSKQNKQNLQPKRSPSATLTSSEKPPSTKPFSARSAVTRSPGTSSRTTITQKGATKSKRPTKRPTPIAASTAPTLAPGPAPAAETKLFPRTSDTTTPSMSNPLGMSGLSAGIAENPFGMKGLDQTSAAAMNAAFARQLSGNASALAMNHALAAGMLPYPYPMPPPFLTTPEAMAYQGRPMAFVNGAQGAQLIPMDFFTQATAMHYRNAMQAAQVAYGAQHAHAVYESQQAAQVRAAQVQVAQAHAAQAQAAHIAQVAQMQAAHAAQAAKVAQPRQDTQPKQGGQIVLPSHNGKSSLDNKVENVVSPATTVDSSQGTNVRNIVMAGSVSKGGKNSRRARYTKQSNVRAAFQSLTKENAKDKGTMEVDYSLRPKALEEEAGFEIDLDGEDMSCENASDGNCVEACDEEMERDTDEEQGEESSAHWDKNDEEGTESQSELCDTMDDSMVTDSSRRKRRLLMLERTGCSEEQARENRARARQRLQQKKSARGQPLTVRYACRKRIAMVRPRVNGRFATKEEVEENNRKAEETNI